VGHFSSPKGQVNDEYLIKASNQVLYDTNITMEYSYKVLEFSSRRIKLSRTGHLTVSERSKRKLGINSIINTMLYDVAEEVVSETFDAIYPAQLLFTPSGTPIINRGHVSVNKGDIFSVYQSGEEIIDPASGQSLGAEKIHLGEVSVRHANEEYSEVESLNGLILLPDQEYVVTKVKSVHRVVSTKQYSDETKEDRVSIKKQQYLN
jgi:hypothetical protein